MPAMKVTPDAAMRARDVSRPHAKQLRWAEEAEASVADAAPVAVAVAGSAEENVAVETEVLVEVEVMTRADVVTEADVTGGSPRRRIRGTRSSRRGRPSR
jgi:hypothetical protein